MNTDKKYNGWKNYETWNCILWIDNDRTYECFRDRAEELRSEDPDNCEYNLAREIEQWIDDNDPLAGSPSMYADMLGSALREIDFDEIAEHIISDLDPLEEEEEEEEEEVD